jgi:hypothetical protein
MMLLVRRCRSFDGKDVILPKHIRMNKRFPVGFCFASVAKIIPSQRGAAR